jgi:hypothetical protein
MPDVTRKPRRVIDTAVHRAVAQQLCNQLIKYNEDEGYNTDTIEPSSPLVVMEGSAVSYCAQPGIYLWYRVKCTGPEHYVEEGWMAQHPRLGFLYAEHLDGEDL